VFYYLNHMPSPCVSYFGDRILCLCLDWPGPQFFYLCFPCRWNGPHVLLCLVSG
jgi:hypothetical protein